MHILSDLTRSRQLNQAPDGFNTMPDHDKASMPNTGWNVMTTLSFASGIFLSFLSALVTYVNFIKLQLDSVTYLLVGGGIILSLFGALVAYVNLVKVYRYRNVKKLMTKYGYNNDFKSYEHMTVEIAQEIYFNLARYDMPFLFEFGWILNFLKVSDTSHRVGIIVFGLHICQPLPYLRSYCFQTSLVPDPSFLELNVNGCESKLDLLLQLEVSNTVSCMQATLTKIRKCAACEDCNIPCACDLLTVYEQPADMRWRSLDCHCTSPLGCHCQDGPLHV